MIGKLTGVIDELYIDSIILDVNGTGYLIYVPQNILITLKIADKNIFYIHTYIREDVLKLYGFSTKEHLEWFLLLQEVPKIGAKVAFTILGTLKIAELSKAIALDEEAIIAKAPGVGKKVAMRIITELKNKNVISSIKPENTAHLDAISALTNLGYNKEQSTIAVSESIKEYGKNLDCASLVRYSLKKLAVK